MAEESPNTPPNDPVETPPAENPPTGATPTVNDPVAANDDDEVVTLKKADYNKIISQRDSNHQRATATEQYAIEQMQKDDINQFLSDPAHKEKFPDVEVSDLMVARDPEEFEQLATQTQARIDKATQRRLGDIEKTTDPVLTPEERSAKLKKLKQNPGMSALEGAIALDL
jgi:hypothetical protein